MSPREEEQIKKNYIECSSCDHVLECRERGKHGMCINYEPIKKLREKDANRIN